MTSRRSLRKSIGATPDELVQEGSLIKSILEAC